MSCTVSVLAPLRRIELAVCAMRGTTLALLHSKTKRQPIADARMLAMFLARELTPLTLEVVAGYFGRERTDAYHAHKTINNRASVYRDLAREIQVLKASMARTDSER